MSDILTNKDLNDILESLKYSKKNFEETVYPTYEMKRERLDEIERLIDKVRMLKNE